MTAAVRPRGPSSPYRLNDGLSAPGQPASGSEVRTSLDLALQSRMLAGLQTGSVADEQRLIDAVSAELQRGRTELPRLERQVATLRQQLGQARRNLALAQADLAESRRLAHSDALTGLPNRLGFDELSTRALAAHQPGGHVLALLFVDLDGFKAVNDRLGHALGDEVLRIVGARLAHAVRHGDLVCRHGGDEFLCLLPHLDDSARAATIARTLEEAIAQPCQVDGHSVALRASVGIAMYPRDGSTVAALLAHADAAMYAVKAGGHGAPC